MRIKTILVTLAAIAISSLTDSAKAQTGYQPPSFLRDASSNIFTTGATLWTFDVDSSGQIIGPATKQIAHGDTLWFCPRVLDPMGYPRPWSTNTVFYLFYQSGAGMVSSNLWWWDTSTNYFPVYHDVQQTESVPTVYNVVNRNLTVAVTTTYQYNTNGVATNSVVTYTTNSTTTSSTTTNYVRTVQTVSVVDTGRVAIAFSATNDFGFAMYSGYIVGVSGATVSQPVRFQLNCLPSPTFNASVAPTPFNWIGTFSTSLTNLFTYSLRVTTNGAPTSWYLLQTPSSSP